MAHDPEPLKRILALDLGQVRTGVAVSDSLGWTAQPIGVIKTCPYQKAVARIRDLVRQYEVGTIVVGMPYNMTGSEGPQAAWVRQFAKRLARAVKGTEIAFWDERLTTFEAEELLIESGMRGPKRKQHRDKIAAALILQSYLEHLRSSAARRPDSTPPSGS